MSDRLLSRLSERLGLSESETAPVLSALLKQVRQRAEKGSGVRIPELGTFSTDEQGVLQFDPDSALKEAANEAYAGLEEKPAVSPDDSASESSSSSEPVKRDEDSTAEIEPPLSSSPSGTSSKDSSPDSDSSKGRSSTSKSDAPPTDKDTGSLWPSDTSSADSNSEAGDSHDDPLDEDFWSRDREWDLSKVAFGDEPDEDFSFDSATDDAAKEEGSTFSLGDSFVDDDPVPDADPEPASNSPSTDAAASQNSNSETSHDVSGDEIDHSPKKKKGSRLRKTIVVFFIIAAFAGTWIVLGERGTVPGPGAVVETVRSSLLSPSSASEEEETPPVEPTDSVPENEETSPTTEAPETTPPTTDDEAADETEELPSDPQTDTAEPSPIDLNEGGWTLVVASRTAESEAEELRSMFASSLQEAGLPVDILPSEGPDGTTRYRVIVGQFSSQDAARSIQQLHSDLVPEDAWALQL